MTKEKTEGWIASLNKETIHLHEEVEKAYRAGWKAGAADSNEPQDIQEIALTHDWKNYQSKRRIQ